MPGNKHLGVLVCWSHKDFESYYIWCNELIQVEWKIWYCLAAKVQFDTLHSFIASSDSQKSEALPFV